MSRREDQQALADVADQYEPRLEAQFIRAAAKLSAGVQLDALTLALADGAADRAYAAAMTDTRLAEAMAPLETVIREELIPRGGRLGAQILNRS